MRREFSTTYLTSFKSVVSLQDLSAHLAVFPLLASAQMGGASYKLAGLYRRIIGYLAIDHKALAGIFWCIEPPTTCPQLPETTLNNTITVVQTLLTRLAKWKHFLDNDLITRVLVNTNHTQPTVRPRFNVLVSLDLGPKLLAFRLLQQYKIVAKFKSDSGIRDLDGVAVAFDREALSGEGYMRRPAHADNVAAPSVVMGRTKLKIKTVWT